jgi:hypothetical protein
MMHPRKARAPGLRAHATGRQRSTPAAGPGRGRGPYARRRAAS